MLEKYNAKDVLVDRGIEYGSFKFVAYGEKENGEIIKINLDDEKIGIPEYATHLYIPEWLQIEKFLEKHSANCHFKIQGIVIRRKDGSGTMDMVIVLERY